MPGLLHRLWGALLWVFYSLPSIVGLLLAAFGTAVGFMEEAQQNLKERKVLRWAIASILILAGIGAFTSDVLQRSKEERAIKDVSMDVRNDLKQEYHSLVESQRNEISRLKSQLNKQTSDLATIKKSNIVSGKKPVKVEVVNPTSQPNRQVQLLPSISWSQRRGSDVKGKATTQVVFSVSSDLALPAFLAVCKGPCKTIGGACGILSQGTFLSGSVPNVAGMVFNIPRPLPDSANCTLTLISPGTGRPDVARFIILKRSQLPITMQ